MSKLLGISLDIKDYIIAGLLAGVLVLGVYAYHTGRSLEIAEATKAAFIAETQAQGKIQVAATVAENARLKLLVRDANHENTIARNALSVYADKLRELAAGTSGRDMPGATAASRVPKAPKGTDEARCLEGTRNYLEEMARIRRELTELVIEGSEDAQALDNARDWAGGI